MTIGLAHPETDMKFPILSGACLILAFSPALAQADEVTPMGDWSRGDGKAKVRIEPCGKDICAINTWIKAGNRDEKVGDKLVMTVTPAGTNWTGKAYDPQRKLTYRLTMTVNEKTMTTRGCVLGGLICKGTDWTRIES